MGAASALAVTVHDPGGHFLPGLVRLEQQLRDTFSGGGAVVTDRTHPDVVRFLSEQVGWEVCSSERDGRVGLHRRLSLDLALRAGAGTALYSDVDHILRWLEAAPAEVATALEADGADLLVVGRSDEAMLACPARLRETERLVNHAYSLMTGRPWDVMFGIRRLSGPLARDIVANCTEDSLANDVEWPLFAERTGYRLAYLASDSLTYRLREDLDTEADLHDSDPALWIHRIEIANLHAQVLKRYLVS